VQNAFFTHAYRTAVALLLHHGVIHAENEKDTQEDWYGQSTILPPCADRLFELSGSIRDSDRPWSPPHSDVYTAHFPAILKE
jgi:hypothetical protein